METKETTRCERAAPTRPVASFKAGRGARNKEGPGGQRNALIRLDSAKEIQGFSLISFAGLCWMRPGFGWIRVWLGKI